MNVSNFSKQKGTETEGLSDISKEYHEGKRDVKR